MSQGTREPQDTRGLLSAYEATHYFVEGLPSPLRPGQPNADLADFLARHEAASLAVLTAYNPRSETLPRAENAARQDRLKAALSEQGLRFVPAEGRGLDGPHPPEPLLCVFDAPPALLQRLMQEFEQNAVVQAQADGTPRLLLLPEFELELKRG